MNGYKKWPVEWMETTLLDIFKEEKESLVYLTHESTTVLEKLDSSKARDVPSLRIGRTVPFKYMPVADICVWVPVFIFGLPFPDRFTSLEELWIGTD